MMNAMTRNMPMNSAAETTPNGPSTRTGKVHRQNFGFKAIFLQTNDDNLSIKFILSPESMNN